MFLINFGPKVFHLYVIKQMRPSLSYCMKLSHIYTHTHTHTENPHGTWGNKEREEGFVHFMTAHSGVGRAEL